MSDQNPFQAPLQQNRAELTSSNEGDATGGLIPYKNPHACMAYYLGIVALLPVIGLPFGIASIILGIIGLKNRKANPVIKGSVHAWIGICFGVFSMLCGGGIVISIVISSFSTR